MEGGGGGVSAAARPAVEIEGGPRAGRGRAEGAGLVARLGGELGVAHGEPLRLGAQLLHERLGALGDGARLRAVLQAHRLLRGEQLLHLGARARVLLARVGELPLERARLVLELLLVQPLPLHRLVLQRGELAERLQCGGRAVGVRWACGGRMRRGVRWACGGRVRWACGAPSCSPRYAPAWPPAAASCRRAARSLPPPACAPAAAAPPRAPPTRRAPARARRPAP